jgi:hypothetical protein
LAFGLLVGFGDFRGFLVEFAGVMLLDSFRLLWADLGGFLGILGYGDLILWLVPLSFGHRLCDSVGNRVGEMGVCVFWGLWEGLGLRGVEFFVKLLLSEGVDGVNGRVLRWVAGGTDDACVYGLMGLLLGLVGLVRDFLMVFVLEVVLKVKVVVKYFLILIGVFRVFCVGFLVKLGALVNLL